MYSFHKNENSSVTGETIYGLFKPFCNTKKGSMSTCKNVFGVRCQYHDENRCISLPTLDHECNVVRTKIPTEDEHVFSRYDTCGHQNEFTAAISINQKSMGGRKGDKTEPRRLLPLLVRDLDGSSIDWQL